MDGLFINASRSAIVRLDCTERTGINSTAEHKTGSFNCRF